MLSCLISSELRLSRKLTRRVTSSSAASSPLPSFHPQPVPLILLAPETGLYATSEESLSRRLVILPVIQHIHLSHSPDLLLMLCCVFSFGHNLLSFPPRMSSFSHSLPLFDPSVMTSSHRLYSVSTLHFLSFFLHTELLIILGYLYTSKEKISSCLSLSFSGKETPYLCPGCSSGLCSRSPLRLLSFGILWAKTIIFLNVMDSMVSQHYKDTILNSSPE